MNAPTPVPAPISMLDAFAETLDEIMAADASVVVLTADLRASCKLTHLFTKYPTRCLDVGIAEQNLVGIAAGLAREGMKPFAVTFAAFASMRACEQYRTSVLYPGLNVKLVGTHSGVSHSVSGSTHFSLEDVGIIRSMPRSTVVVPADAASVMSLTRDLARTTQPAYLRLDRNALPNIYRPGVEAPRLGEVKVLRPGVAAGGIALVAMGSMLSVAVGAAELLTVYGHDVRLVDVPTVKPVDAEALARVLSSCRAVVTVEEHNTIGGLGSAVAEVIAERLMQIKLARVGIAEAYPNGATADDMRKLLGLTPEAVAEAAIRLFEAL